MPFKPIRFTKLYEMTVPAAPDRVFPLLCPVREHEWLPYWKCRMIYSESGVAEEGAVFQTDLPGAGEMTWTVTQYQPPQRIQYTSFKSASHVRNLAINLARLDGDQCQLTWRHTFTALTEAGNESLSNFTDEQHRLQMTRIERCLVHFLETHQMLEKPDA